ncbi:MAG: gamma-glutamyltransferase [Ostreibacterium sp.]
MKKIYGLFFSLILVSSNLNAKAILEGERSVPVQAQNGMVVTSHFLATQRALKVLEKGGNAIDAAVTAAFALAVTQPRSGNIGGGGFMLISNEKTGKVVAIDYREKAPAAAYKDMYLDKNGNVDKKLSRFSHLSSGVPGTVAGLALALKKYGTISLQEALAPAIKLAEKGFILTPRFVKGVHSKKEMLSRFESSKKKFFKKNGKEYKVGDLYIQKDLANTLKRISKYGAKEFYTGKTAKLIAKEMENHNGMITLDDLKNYKPVIRKPIHGTYRGYDIFSMPPPSSGGVHIVQILNMMENYDIGKMGHNSAATVHIMAEAMRRAYADRATYLGDSDFVKVPVKGLISKAYAKKLMKNVTDNATPSKDIKAGDAPAYESNQTTHFSIADKYGNAVSNTYTLNFSYGSGIVVNKAGFLLNNEMDDFSAKPGVPNAYGLMGGEANKIEPAKRMLSSMSPTIVKKEGKNFLITGSPGGSRIITTTLQVISNVIDHHLNILVAVSAPRMHHQWLPDEIRIEQGFSPDTIKILEAQGYKVKQKASMGAIQSIMIKDGVFYGGADPRRSTSSAKGF